MAPGATINTEYGVYRVRRDGAGFKAFIESPPLPESPLHHDERSYHECVMLVGLHMKAHTQTADMVINSILKRRA